MYITFNLQNFENLVDKITQKQSYLPHKQVGYFCTKIKIKKNKKSINHLQINHN